MSSSKSTSSATTRTWTLPGSGIERFSPGDAERVHSLHGSGARPLKATRWRKR